MMTKELATDYRHHSLIYINDINIMFLDKEYNFHSVSVLKDLLYTISDLSSINENNIKHVNECMCTPFTCMRCYSEGYVGDTKLLFRILRDRYYV